MPNLNLALPIRATAERVFEACTDAKQLTRWFAEAADINLAAGSFDFWGRHTPGDPGHDDGRHKITQHEPGHKVAFEWFLRDVMTEVEFEVATEGDHALLTMRHSNLPELKPYQSSIGDFWTHVLEGLRQMLERGKPHPMMDFRDTPKGDVHLALEIGANPHDVFLGLIEPSRLDRWISTGAKVDPKPGGEYTFGWEHGPVKILDIIPDQKLSYKWSWPEEGDTVTTWELQGSGGNTRLTVVQSGFAPERNSEDYYIGWFKFAYRLKTMLEVGPSFERVRVLQDQELSGEV